MPWVCHLSTPSGSHPPPHPPHQHTHTVRHTGYSCTHTKNILTEPELSELTFLYLPGISHHTEQAAPPLDDLGYASPARMAVAESPVSCVFWLIVTPNTLESHEGILCQELAQQTSSQHPHLPSMECPWQPLWWESPYLQGEGDCFIGEH